MSNNIFTSREIGNYYEDDAVSYLSKNGFEIIERNFYAKWGEIDIVASKDGVVHFVEVKGGETFEPIYNITPSKLKKIIKTALGYLQKKSLDTPFCIDALIVKNRKIDFMENITI